MRLVGGNLRGRGNISRWVGYLRDRKEKMSLPVAYDRTTNADQNIAASYWK